MSALPMFTQTLKQYADAIRDEYVADNPELSKAEYERHYSVQSRYTDWLNSMEQSARNGSQIRALVLDSIPESFAWHLLKFYPNCFPHDYLLPRARKANAAYEQTIRDIRNNKEVSQ